MIYNFWINKLKKIFIICLFIIQLLLLIIGSVSSLKTIKYGLTYDDRITNCTEFQDST
jgi:hypothetical protein